MSRTAEHLHHLATGIGPRPATTDAEAQAADYIEDVFRERGLAVERQEFDAPRTYSWAFVTYHLLTIGAAVAAGWQFLLWPALAVAVAVAFLLWMDLDTRFGLTGWLPPKGPSQNIIARHIPKARRGERLARVVIVAHYDSAKASLAFAPSMVKNFSITFALMKGCTFAVPVLIVLGALPFTEAWNPWLWYATLASSAYLVVPLLINVHRELAMGFVDGANDNASGVAVMLGVMERITPAPDEFGTTSPGLSRQAPLSAEDVGAVPAGTESGYVQGGAWDDDPSAYEDRDRDIGELPDDFKWAETPAERRRDVAPAQSHLDFDTVEFDAVQPQETSADEWDSVSGPVTAPIPGAADAPRRTGILGRIGRKRRGVETEGVRGWLGVGEGFDAREAGKKIGSWEHFDNDDDDEFGVKGGRAGGDPLGDPDYTSDEAARIRRRVTEGIDRSLADKEVWFVATGSEETGTWGMQALLDAFGPELRDARIINLDNLGAGTLHMVTEEGMARGYRSDRRLLSAGKRVSSEHDLPVRSRAYRALSTDATRALARGYRAMSIMAFDINGRLPHWHWHSDVEDNVDPRNLEIAEEFVTELVRSL